MLNLQRRRLGSTSDNSAPSSDISEVSEICETSGNDWNSDGEPHSMPAKLQYSLGLMPHDTSTQFEDELELDNGTISEYERSQLESFFSGLGTEVFVSSSLANLYESLGKDDWRLVYTGIPVLLHDKGSTRSRTVPRVSFVLAERGTCFALWKDTIDSLSNYRVADAAFHTMCLSGNQQRTIGFSFDSNQAAREVWMRVEELMSNPENNAQNAQGRKKKTQKRTKPVLPPKSQISQPCQFHHVSSVTRSDAQRYFSLQAFVSPPSRHKSS